MTLWQTHNWEQFQKALGVRTCRVGKILILIKPLPFSRSMLEVQRANPTKGEWGQIYELAKREHAVFCRYAPETLTPTLPDLPIRKRSNPIFPDATSIVDLSRSETDIFAGFSAIGRRHIRLAERGGVEISESNDAVKFAELSQITAKRDGFRAHNERFFRSMLDTFRNNIRILVAQKEKEWLAAGIFMFVGDTAVYYYGASSDSWRELNAPTLLQWEAMKMAKQKGCVFFDLLGIAPNDDENHRLAGVTRFKKKFSGDLIRYAPECDILFSPNVYTILQWAKKFRGLFK